MAEANSTAMAGTEPAINTLSAEERLGALREENEVLAAALERMEQASTGTIAQVPGGFDPFELATAFQHIEGLADTLLCQAPRRHCDLIYSIRTIAQHFGAKVQAMSEEFGGSLPGPLEGC